VARTTGWRRPCAGRRGRGCRSARRSACSRRATSTTSLAVATSRAGARRTRRPIRRRSPRSSAIRAAGSPAPTCRPWPGSISRTVTTSARCRTSC
jgi:hypothetical protein